jgi:DNA-binding GntR family transcriptional regulator
LELAADGQIGRSMIENQRFHFAIYEAAGSDTLLENIKQVWVRVGLSVNLCLPRSTHRIRRDCMRDSPITKR